MYVFSKIDLDHFIKESSGNEDAINLDDQEIRIFRNALDFSKIKIRDCMLQRTDIAAVEDHDSIEKVKQQFIITRYSKLLVYHENIDNIIGYIKYKDLFKNPRSIDPLIRSLPVVPETMNANKLLRELLLERKGLALVVDEFGGTSGIITIEDILEEIFGEIMDEHDTDEIIEKMLSNDTYIFSGKIPIDYIRKKYHINIAESDEYDTLAGYLIHSLGRIPLQDETFDLGDFSGKIIRAGKTRIELINVKVT
jgi:CBS domain containing-hemolysin-like protein